MSCQNYNKAKKIIGNHPERCSFSGPCPPEFITLAESKVGLTFSPIYRDFLSNFGAGNFGTREIFGVVNNSFDNLAVPDAIWYTLAGRQEINLPSSLLIIYDTGCEELLCLDFIRRSKNGEPAVVSFVPGDDMDQQRFEVIANDFGDFLLKTVYRAV